MFLGESFDKVPDEQDTDPCSYNEAIQDKNSKFWQRAMMCEMEFMYSNQVLNLVEPPEGIEPFGCKWIYKKKRGVYDKVKTFKATLIAKGFTQKEGIDYEKTFSPVTMLKSIRILLSIAFHFDLTFGKWMARQHSLMKMLTSVFIWCNQMDS